MIKEGEYILDTSPKYEGDVGVVRNGMITWLTGEYKGLNSRESYRFIKKITEKEALARLI